MEARQEDDEFLILATDGLWWDGCPCNSVLWTSITAERSVYQMKWALSEHTPDCISDSSQL